MDTKPARVPLDTVAHHEPAKPEPPALPAIDLNEFNTVPPEELRDKIIGAISTCYDPEIPVNIYELGLIYDIAIDPPGSVAIKMSLTSPACPAAGSIPPEVESKVRAVPGVRSAKVEVVWEPPWTQDRMTEAARLQLGLF